MDFQINRVYVWLILMLCPSTSQDLYIFGQDSMINEDKWSQRTTSVRVRTYRQPWLGEKSCKALQPSNAEVIKRFCAILPYFDKDHENSAFLHKLLSTILSMANSEDPLDRETAMYTTVFIPMVFLNLYRDTWCLLERFHRALRLFQLSYPTEKRSSLKMLQNLRSINQKIRNFVTNLPGSIQNVKTTTPFEQDTDEEEKLSQRKDVRYLKELIKNLG